MKESNLYMYSSLISFLAFLVCIGFVMNKPGGPVYGVYLMGVIGLLSLSKSGEYYEKYLYKKSKSR
tara:strand:+ start:271 stop:468 length:198 start_codon:yes stop_codon:yes gene_type:complete